MKNEKKPKITGTISFTDAAGHPLDEAGMNQLSEKLIMAILKSAEPEEDEELSTTMQTRNG